MAIDYIIVGAELALSQCPWTIFYVRPALRKLVKVGDQST